MWCVIKVRSVFSQGKLFPAYVKVVGKAGDIGVLLQRERNEEGATLYITSHVDHVHQRIGGY